MRSWLKRHGVFLVTALVVGMVLFTQFISLGSDVIPVEDQTVKATDVAWFGMAIVATGTGALILSRERRHGVGWTLVAYGILGGSGSMAYAIAILLVEADLRSAGALAEGVGSAAITVALVSTPVALLLFPDGTLPSARWRPLAWAMGGAVAAGAVAALVKGGFGGDPSDSWFAPGPLEDALGGVAEILSVVFFVLVAISVLGGVASLVLRFRQSQGEERLQLKWVAAAAGLFGVAIVITLFEAGAGVVSGWVEVLLILSLASIPIAMAVAILKYRLYDIDLVISKSVTYLSLTVALTVLYGAAVLTFIQLFADAEQRESGNLGVALPIGATLLAAIAFEPLRVRLQRLANRLVYGRRAAPHEVLSQLTTQLAHTSAGGGLDALAELLRDGTAADKAVVWLRVGTKLRAEAASPAGSLAEFGELEVGAEQESSVLKLSVPVRHRDETLGAVTIYKSQAYPVTSADRALLSDVAAGAGLLLHNLRLTAELEQRAEELQTSRRRLIAAHDAERRRLERDLHDGAQQEVVALKVRLGLAHSLAEREGAENVASLVSSLADETQRAVDAIRLVAHGIYPPLLEAEGLEPALATAARVAQIPVRFDAGGIGRYPRGVEETAYFCVVEAVEAARLSGATEIRISLEGSAGALLIDIDHNGRAAAADSGPVADRVEAFGGSATTEWLAEQGARARIRLPIQRPVMEPA